MTPVASVAAVDGPAGPNVHATLNRPNMVQVGTIVWLSSELMFFAGLFAMYFTIRAVQPELWATEPLKLDIPFSTINTINLVLSSVWCQMGVFAAERFQPSALGTWWAPWTREHKWRNWGMREWYLLTYVAGAVFICGQVYEYAHLIAEGLTLGTNGYGSVFYMTTGFHGMHVTGGLIAFLLIIGRSFAAKRFGHAEATSAIVTSYYWHFVDVVWIGLFFVIYVIK
ncbi:aa3-type cytochrome oxidase subunit III [Kineosporia rhizophila]|uniref:aa3-type cytochrome oxidase subunit III n=2 Tax=Kineosporia TaxID=49184 RepID=UPI000ACD8156